MALESSKPLEVLTRFRFAVVALALLIIVVLGWRGREPLGLTSGDDLTYLALSKSLESGSYRETFLAGAPLHVKYPPGYPLWLLAVRKVGGENLDVIRGTNLALLAVFALCLYGIVRRVAGVPLALAAVLLVALNHTLLRSGGTLLSEPLFLALVGASLLCTVRAGPADGRYAAGAIGFAVAAYLTRSAGLALLLALGLWLWQRRRLRELIAYAAISLLAVGGWFAYTASVPPALSGWSYGLDVARGLRTSIPGVGARFLQSFWSKSVGYVTEGLPWSVGLPSVRGTILDNLAWLATMVVLLLAGLLVCWRKARAVVGYMIFGWILLTLWPWRVERLLEPLVPFVIAGMLIGMQSVTARAPAAWRVPAILALVVLMGFGAVRSSLARDVVMSKCDRNDPYRSPGCYQPEARVLVEAAEYLRLHAPPGSIVVTVDPPGMNYLSGLRTERPQLLAGLPEGTAVRTLRERKIEYVVLYGRGEFERRRLAPALLRSCRELRVEARFGPRGLLLFTDSPRTAAEDACAALDALAVVPPSGDIR
jgi:4-amino-4-deoxy-L-arabinose transferase-like glycosyltransferase